MQSTNAEWTIVKPMVFAVPTTLVLGVFLLVVALLLQITTYVPSADVMPVGVASALTLNADACFLYVFRRGGWAIRVCAGLCGLAALFNTFILLRWAVITIHR